MEKPLIMVFGPYPSVGFEARKNPLGSPVGLFARFASGYVWMSVSRTTQPSVSVPPTSHRKSKAR
jgi:hypothetical protein